MNTGIRENRIERIMQGWRLRVQTRMMVFGALLAFPAVVQTLWRAIQYPQELNSAIILVLLYLGIVGLAFLQRIPVRIRGWLLILFLYIVGVVAMARGGLWGDGRIYLVLLPVFGVLLIDVGAGMFLVAVSVLTFSAFGFFNHIGFLDKWMISHQLPMPTEIWVYDGLIFATLMLTAVIVMVDFYKLLIKTLSNEHKTAENLRTAHQLLDQANQDLEDKVSQRTSELAEANQRLHHIVNHDSLTGLPNRILFYDRLATAISGANRNRTKLAVLFIDIDDFKMINDTLGHICGDMLLTKMADRLEENMRETDTLARLSGDEFAIILRSLTESQDAVDSASRILEFLAKPFNLGKSTASLSASIGISIYPEDAEDPDELVGYADAAMYRVKHTTKGDFQFYSEDRISQQIHR